MAQRKAIGPKLRFEVFKRDSFTCQYCGGKAPDVVLSVDHIKPVCEGGENEILNLVTACSDCNLGKGPRELSDDAEIKKQQRQLEDLNERRLQLEMLLKWRQGLSSETDLKVQALVKRMLALDATYGPNEKGEKDIRRWLRRFTVEELLEAVDISFEQYLEHSEGEATSESWNKAFSKIPGVAHIRKESAGQPYIKDAYYIRGILRNRVNWWARAERDSVPLLLKAMELGVGAEALKRMAAHTSSYSRFEAEVQDLVEDASVALEGA